MGRHVLLAGCGYVATALGRRLVAGGDRVTALRRDTSGLPDSFARVTADLTDPTTLTGIPGDLDAIVYTASPDARTEAAYRAAYVDGLRCLLDTVGRTDNRPGRLLLVTSTAVYGVRDGRWVDETSPTGPDGATGRVLLEAEQVAADAPIPSVAVRFGGIYGPGRTRLIDRVRAGEAVCPRKGPVYTNRIHRDDTAGVLHHLLGVGDPEAVYLGVDDEPADRCAVLRWLAEQLDAPVPDMAATDRRRSNKRCSNRRLLATGYEFVHPTYRHGYRDLLDATPSRAR